MTPLFFIFFLLVWLNIVFYTGAVGYAALFVMLFGIVYFLSKRKTILFSRVLLAPSKAILAISFWGCVAFCLFAFQQSITCLGCMQAYLGRALNASFGNLALSDFKQFMRVEILFMLACVWAAIFILTIQKGDKKC